MLRVVFLLYWRISVACLALGLVSSWEEFGCSAGMETFGLTRVLMLPGIKGSMMFSSFGVKASASGFQRQTSLYI